MLITLCFATAFLISVSDRHRPAKRDPNDVNQSPKKSEIVNLAKEGQWKFTKLILICPLIAKIISGF